MKTIAILIAILLLGSTTVAALSQEDSTNIDDLMNNPEVLKVIIPGQYGPDIFIIAWMGDDGRWWMMYSDDSGQSAKATIGNETGYVMAS
jgi:hypothetical protein